MKTILEDFKETRCVSQTRIIKWCDFDTKLLTTAMLARDKMKVGTRNRTEGSRHGVTLVFAGAYQDLVTNQYDNFVKLVNQLVRQVFLGVCA